MSSYDGSGRPWREIARELAREKNSKRVLELSHELSEAIAAQGMDVSIDGFDDRPKPDGSSERIPPPQLDQEPKSKT
jgi:hypothetical protein